jgi:hypothetical protein
MSDFKRVVRQRVSVSTTSKGYHTFSCDVEITEELGRLDKIYTTELMMASDALVKSLDIRYPKPKDIA